MRLKKNVKTTLNKVISLIDIELQIIQWKIQYRYEYQPEKRQTSSILKWSGTGAELVEFAYGAYETKKFNNGEVDINQLVNQLCTMFSFEVKDCYDTFRAIRRRVGSRTLFLNEMIEKLNERMDDMDNGIFKKKKIRK